MLNKLFDFFSQNEFETTTATAPVKVAVATPQNSELEIFKTITSAHEMLLTASQAILNNINAEHIKPPAMSKDKIRTLQTLKALGFENQPEVVQAEREMEVYKRDLSEYNTRKEEYLEKVRLLTYYQDKYPNNRFIDAETLKNLNTKFGLVTAPVQFYNAEIPDKNKQEIVDFACDIKDKRFLVQFTLQSSDVSSMQELFSDMKFDRERYSYTYTVKLEKLIDAVRLGNMPSNYPFKNTPSLYLYGGRLPYNVSISHVVKSRMNSMLTDAYILAPSHKFTPITDHTLKDGVFAANRVKTEIKDPVVLQPVIGGFLIVSHWGFESTLPEISGEPGIGIHNNSN